MGLKKRHTLVEHPMRYYVDMTETHTRAEHVAWLEQNIPDGYRKLWDFGGPNRVNFLREEDQLMFVLRWA